MITFGLFVIHNYHLSEVSFSPEERKLEIETMANRNSIFYSAMLILNCFPFLYTNMQIYSEGCSFFNEPGNIMIPVFIVMGFAFVPIHNSLGSQSHITKSLMIAQLLMHLIFIMKYIRIFESMSLLVTLLSRVFVDIKNLVSLFVFIVLYFSFALFILGFKKGDEYE